MKFEILDVKNIALGRAAVKAALLLRGKDKPDFAPNKIPETKVKILNFEKILFNDKKKEQKIYKRYSGYPGGLKEIPYEKFIEKDNRKAFIHAVYGMLPKNKLRSKIIKNLIIERLTKS